MDQGTFGPGDICSQDNFVQIAHCCAISWRLSMREIFYKVGQATKREWLWEKNGAGGRVQKKVWTKSILLLLMKTFN